MPSDADYWYALGVKDGRDGCLVELDALQARCDKLEAERNQVIQELLEKALGSEADNYKAYDGYVAEWLRSQMEEENDPTR